MHHDVVSTKTSDINEEMHTGLLADNDALQEHQESFA